MSKLNQEGKVYFVDRDFVAIEYTKINCEENHCKNAEFILSDGFFHIPESLCFDIITSHLPTHISNDMLIGLIEEAKNHLNTEGRFYVVTVSKLKKFMKRELERVFDNYEKIAEDGMYTVSMSINK